MYVSARGDYAVRALLHLAAAYPDGVTMNDLIDAQGLPRSYLEVIMPELRRADFVRLWRRGSASYSLARPPAQVSIGAVLRAVDGPLIRVRGLPPEEIHYAGAARGLSLLWLTAAGELEKLLYGTTLADLIGAADQPTVALLRAVTHRT